MREKSDIKNAELSLKQLLRLGNIMYESDDDNDSEEEGIIKLGCAPASRLLLK